MASDSSTRRAWLVIGRCELLSQQMEHKLPPVRRGAVFPNVDALPGAEDQSAVGDGDAQVHGRQRGADVRGHVVITFASVPEKRVAIGCEAGEEAFQVTAHFRIGIFLNEQRGGGVPEVQRGEAGLQPGLADQRVDFARDLAETATARGNGEFLDRLAEHGEMTIRIKITIKE